MSDRDQDTDDRDGLARLAELAKQLPYERPDDARVDSVRSSLLVAATTEERPRSRWFVIGAAFTAGALAAAAAVLVVVHGSREPAPAVAPNAGDGRAWIEGSTAADFEREITRTSSGVDEIVRVRGGRLGVSVGTLASGERVRVTTGDAEVEGQGRYEVAVVDDRLREVSVKEGTARVRVTGHESVFLATGQRWQAPVVAADLRPVPTPDVPDVPDVRSNPPPGHPPDVRTPDVRAPDVRAPDVRAPDVVRAPAPVTPSSSDHEPLPAVTAMPPTPDAPVPSPSAAPTSATELEHHFAAGMQLFKAGKDAEAAHELGTAAEAPGNEALAADARYFQAVALTRAGRKAEAEAALLAFLDHAPHSMRRGRAEVMLARLIADRGDSSSAKRWFELATRDADPAIVAAAKAGLAKLAP